MIWLPAPVAYEIVVASLSWTLANFQGARGSSGRKRIRCGS
jgi:hypothetical protein